MDLPIFSDNLKSSASWAGLLARARVAWDEARQSSGMRSQIEARTRDVADAAVVREAAATRALALRELERSWKEKSGSLGLPAFDWSAIASALAEVHAL